MSTSPKSTPKTSSAKSARQNETLSRYAIIRERKRAKDKRNDIFPLAKRGPFHCRRCKTQMIELWADTFICPKPYCDPTPAAIVNGVLYTQDMLIAAAEKIKAEEIKKGNARREFPGVSNGGEKEGDV